MAKREVIIELQLQDGEAVQRLGRLEIETKQYQRELRALNAEIAKNGTATAQQTQRVGELNAMLRRNQGEVRELKNDLSGLTAAGMRFRDKMAQASTQALQAFGLNVLTVTGAVTAAIGVFSNAARTVAEFDKALSSIRALGGEYAANIDAIGEAAKTAGINFGFTAQQSLSAVEALAKAGVSVTDILGGGLTGALTLAAAGQLDVATAAETASKAMTQFGLAGQDIPHLADLLAAGAASATGEVTDFAQALNQSGLVASQAGISIEDTVGTLTAFAAAGLLGSDAGTSFRTMLLRLQNPSKESADKMKELGLNAFNAQGQFVGLESLAGQLQERLAGLTEEQRSAALAQIFGSDAVRAANVLYTQGAEGIAKYNEQVNQSGFAQKVAEEQTNNLSGQLGRASAAYDAFILSLENGSGPIAKTVTAFAKMFATILEGFALIESRATALRDLRGEFDEFAEATGQTLDDELIERELQRIRFKQIADSRQERDEFQIELFEGRRSRLEAEVRDLERRQSSLLPAQLVGLFALKVELKGLNKEIEGRKSSLQELNKIESAGTDETETATGATNAKTDAVIKLTAAERKRLDLQKEMQELAGQDATPMDPRRTTPSTPLPEGTPGTNQDYIDETLEAYALEQAAFEELQQAKMDAVQAFGSILSAVSEQGSDAAKIGLAIEKAAAVARVIVNLQSELSAIRANVPNTVGSPDFGVTAKSIASIAAITRAAGSIGIIAAQTIQGFEEGGYTAKKSSNKEPVGVVHANEWVAPAWMVSSPEYQPILSALEKRRKSRGLSSDLGGFFLGGPSTRGTALVNMPTQPSSGTISTADTVRALSNIMNMPIYTRITEINEVMGRYARITEASTI